MNLQKLKQELKADEGVRHTIYKDSLGNWTIGVGHLVLPSELSEYKGRYVEDKEIDALLESDIHKAFTSISSWPVYKAMDTDARQRALINMSFQLGTKDLAGFKNSLRELENLQWAKAGARLRKSLWYRQTPKRAERVIRMLETGEDR